MSQVLINVGLNIMQFVILKQKLSVSVVQAFANLQK